jgi:hypothetical protein
METILALRKTVKRKAYGEQKCTTWWRNPFLTSRLTLQIRIPTTRSSAIRIADTNSRRKPDLFGADISLRKSLAILRTER